MLSYYDTNLSRPRHISANACLTPLCALDGYHVTTIEGIGGMRQGLHPVQKRLASMHGSQCGFCTPGIVMSLYTILRNNPEATPHEIEESLDGNLCRCTGYRPIIDGAKSLSNNKGSSSCCGGSDSTSSCPCKSPSDTDSSSGQLKITSTECLVRSTPSLEEEHQISEPIFPPALVTYTSHPLLFSSHGVTWYQPDDLPSLLAFKSAHHDCRLIVGNTEVGIEVKFKNMKYEFLVNPSRVPELKTLMVEREGLRVGGAVGLETLRQFTASIPNRSMLAISSMLTWFASTQIRNVACLGGNLATASPISDMNPLLAALGAVLTVVSVNGSRTLPVTEFFLAYRKVALRADEIIQEVFIPFVSEFEFIIPLKQARRREDDISIVTSGERDKIIIIMVLYGYLLKLANIAETNLVDIFLFKIHYV
jgi:xanthine dehydrogenase/oxidase